MFFILGLCLCCFLGNAQQDTSQIDVYDAVIENGDTIAVVLLPAATVADDMSKNRRYQRRYSRLEPKVVKVYPYAEAAGELMAQYDEELANIEGKKERKDFVNEAEDALKTQFEGDLKKMTVSEGMILIRLIDRETGDSSYELIKEIKGGFSAFMWQSFARLFGHNLKDTYDPEGDDLIIESIVQRIERNEIQVEKRNVSIQRSAAN
ncbi:MAG: DUF4294 domain-containing protein [Flavobacteriales bacterium]|nr:DUF4294 domain-containing protein [Flavobacteriales bacterium]